ncbi:carbohydrate-binding family 9-like protein [bacterium]|nr:carbohydrate-binding family 9-like protein [bacterium]
MKGITALICIGIVCMSLTSDAAEKPRYTVYRTTGGITIDGALDEADWKAAPAFSPFVFPWWTEGEKEQTEVRMLWDDTFLYITYTCSDKHIWADHFDTNSQTFMDDCVEMFWNPNPAAGLAYNMFEMNCLGNLLSVCNDRKISIHDNRILPPHMSQSIRGTVNDDSDTDTSWTLEIAVRFSDYTKLSSGATPKDGEMWEIGLNRCGGKINPQNSQWSQSQTPTHNFHRPEDFGQIFFSTKKVRK